MTFIKKNKTNSIHDMDINKTLVSKKEPYRTKNSFKYLTGYNHKDVITPLYVRHTQITGQKT